MALPETASTAPAQSDGLSAGPGLAVALLLGMAGLIGLLFFSRFQDLYSLWQHDDNYSHGFLVPFVSAFLAWGVYKKQGAPREGSLRAGLSWIVTGCVLHLWSAVIGGATVDFLSLCTLLYGTAVLAGGRSWAKGFSFPILFLFFMFPLPQRFTDWLAVELQAVVTPAAAFVLQLFVPTVQNGNHLKIAGQGMEVGEACSGIRQMVAFAALTSLVAFLTKRNLFFRLGIFLAGFPVAILANLIRILLMAFLLLNFGEESISDKKPLIFGLTYHTGWGLLTMVAGLFLLLGAAWWLGRVFPQADAKSAEDKGPDETGPAAEDKDSASREPEVQRPSPALPRYFSIALGCLALTLLGQWGLHQHLEAASRLAPSPGMTQPLQSFPERLGDWTRIKDETPTGVARDLFLVADDKLYRSYRYAPKIDDSVPLPTPGDLTCTVWIWHFRNAEDRRHHPKICFDVGGWTEDPEPNEPEANKRVVLEPADTAPARRFCFTRPDAKSYVYYWHYTFVPENNATLSPLQRLHDDVEVRRPSLTAQVFGAPRDQARKVEDLERLAEFVRKVDQELQQHLPPSARRGSDLFSVRKAKE
jgi:exosortase